MNGSLASTGKYEVKGLVRNLEKAKEALLSSAGGGLEIELEQGDILDESSLVAAMKVTDGVPVTSKERRVAAVSPPLFHLITTVFPKNCNDIPCRDAPNTAPRTVGG